MININNGKKCYTATQLSIYKPYSCNLLLISNIQVSLSKQFVKYNIGRIKKWITIGMNERRFLKKKKKKCVPESFHVE